MQNDDDDDDETVSLPITDTFSKLCIGKFCPFFVLNFFYSIEQTNKYIKMEYCIRDKISHYQCVIN